MIRTGRMVIRTQGFLLLLNGAWSAVCENAVPVTGRVTSVQRVCRGAAKPPSLCIEGQATRVAQTSQKGARRPEVLVLILSLAGSG